MKHLEKLGGQTCWCEVVGWGLTSVNTKVLEVRGYRFGPQILILHGVSTRYQLLVGQPEQSITSCPREAICPVLCLRYFIFCYKGLVGFVFAFVCGGCACVCLFICVCVHMCVVCVCVGVYKWWVCICVCSHVWGLCIHVTSRIFINFSSHYSIISHLIFTWTQSPPVHASLTSMC